MSTSEVATPVLVHPQTGEALSVATAPVEAAPVARETLVQKVEAEAKTVIHAIEAEAETLVKDVEKVFQKKKAA